MRRFRLTLAYEGTGLVGWQRQAAGTSVQGLVEAALERLDERPVTVTGAGRTDAGVHALGQVASFTLERNIDPATLVRALNFHLPPAVRALEAAVVDAAFHARFDARAKTYRYQLWTAGPLPPFLRRFAWHVPGPLDVAAMNRAAGLLEGTHDFATFQSVGTDLSDTVREMTSSRVQVVPAAGIGGGYPGPGALVAYDAEGSGFLRHMVRAIVGTLIDVGLGRSDADGIPDLLASRDRSRAGRTAPAEGLCLVRVTY
jgi:tRNA pseudouridine38-40 synthase